MASAVLRFMKRHPFLSNSAFFGSMFVGAEMSQQFFLNKMMVKQSVEKKPLDRAALARYAVMGYAVCPSILYPWYKWLDGRFTGRALSVITKKIVLDVMVLGPIEVLVFFVCMNLMEGKYDVGAELCDKYMSTVVKEVCFWTPVQALNFAMIPASARVAYVGACSFLWLSVLCWVKRKPFSFTPAADGVVLEDSGGGGGGVKCSGGDYICSQCSPLAAIPACG